MVNVEFPSSINQTAVTKGRKARMPVIVRVLIMLFCCGLGLTMLYVGVTQLVQQRRLLSGAHAVEAEIIESHVKQSKLEDNNRDGRDTSTNTYEPIVKFRYTVGKRQFESDLLRPTIIVQTYASRDSALEEIRPFPVGAKVLAHVSADNPEKAFLLAEASVGPTVFIVVGALLPGIAYLVGRYL